MKYAMSQNRPLAAIGAALCGMTAACHYDLGATPELEYSLNEKEVSKNEILAADPADQDRIRGALEFLVGTPQNPSYLVTSEWLDDEFNPGDIGYNRVFEDDELLESLIEGNRAAFASQLAAIEAGDYNAVERPRYAPDLWENWLAYLEEKPEGDDEEWRADSIALFEEYYPSLAASAELYRQQCYHCHGAEGGGNGSTSSFLTPRPRDYRPGKFKFTALSDKARPRHEDLFRILSEGVYTTSMPSFRRFPDSMLHGLADYVRLLSIRGETEILVESFYDPEDGINFENVRENYQDVVERWLESDEKLIAFDGEVPRPTPERIAHGRWLFMTPTAANCIKCHGPEGRGDGESTWVVDEETGEKSLALDEWDNEIQPRDLTTGVFRFGRRPIDLYRRVHAGINGTPMPAHFGQLVTEEDGSQRPLDENDIWDLVFFVRSLSSHDMEQVAATDGDGHGHAHGEDDSH